MTVESPQNRAGPFNGDNVSTDFDFSFPAQAETDVLVIRRQVSTGVESILANRSNYSIALTGNGGRVALASPLLQGYHLVIVRAPAPIQVTDLIENDTYAAEPIEKALDYNIMVAQRHADLLTRALILADSDTYGSGAFRAGGNRITGAGDAVLSTDLTTLAQVQQIVADGGGSGGGGGGGSNTWPTIPLPSDILEDIIGGVLTAAEFNAVFTPINSQIGNLAASVLALNSQYASVSTSVGSINTTITSMQADIDALSAISGDASNIITLISNEATSRIAGDAATASVIAKLGAAAGDNVSFIMNTNTVRISPTETLAVRFGGISTTLAANTAAVSTEQTARIAGDNALASTISKIGAQTADGVSFIFALDSARVSATETLGQRLASIASAVNGSNAAIATEQTTRASADSSLATQLSTLQSTVGGFNTAIQQNATAINGVYASYSVKIDNNGRVAGFGLISQPNNGAIVSSFIFNADAFSIYNGSSAVAPFTVIGGVVYAQNLRVRSAEIEDLTVSKLTAGTLNANMNFGTGKIILDNGSRILAFGTGFGTSNQFYMWAGPRPAGGDLSLCSEAAATFYLNANSAAAYFGGSLSAGTIFNSNRSTDLANNVNLILGPFATNGNAKTLVFSYSYVAGMSTGGGGGNSSGPITATIQCYRKIGAASETNIATLNVTGTYSIVTSPGDGSQYTQSMGGSLTFTDNVAGTGDRTIRANITSRVLGFSGGARQDLSITSTEQ